MSDKALCFHCQKELTMTSVGRREECPHCRSDVHVCKNCHFYDPRAYNECKEPQADVVKEKDRSNFCDYFQLRKGVSVIDEKAKLKAAAEALFKKST